MEANALTAVWNRLDKNARRAALPSVLSRTVFQMSSNDIALYLVEGAPERIHTATNAERE